MSQDAAHRNAIVDATRRAAGFAAELARWSAYTLAAVLLLNGFAFDNAVLPPLDWQPTRPTSAITASVYRARWIAMARTSFWKWTSRRAGTPVPYDLPVELK